MEAPVLGFSVCEKMLLVLWKTENGPGDTGTRLREKRRVGSTRDVLKELERLVSAYP